MTGYRTKQGACRCGDSLKLMEGLPDGGVNLFFTSPPFALQREKAYGNGDQSDYADWIAEFARIAYRKLADDGSFVIDIGGAYVSGSPEFSLYQFRTLIKLCDEVGFRLAQPFYWYNSAALPAPIEWVNKRKLRAKTAVNTVWWLCKDAFCKADVRKVLAPYSDRMRKLFAAPDDFVKEEGTHRPSGHVLGKMTWAKDNGGAIPPNLLQISNTESNSQYLRHCKAAGIKGHPARFPKGLPEFFIKFLTEPGDLVVDFFAGSNTTGQAAEEQGRKWKSFEIRPDYVASSCFRFLDNPEQAKTCFDRIMAGEYVKLEEYRAKTLLDVD